MNKGVIVGRLVRNPELRYTSSNKAITKITIACNNSKDDTTFLDITIFGKMAETTNEYCQKGDILGIEYIVKNYNWEDEEGKRHFTYNFIANRVEFISKASKSTNKVEIPQEQAKNSLNKDVFDEFGDSVSIDDNFLE
jgi:single-strand DNA-binding protein